MARYQALDLMRGFTVAAMILVNTPGSWDHVYWPLEHAAWDGLSPTDLVFPFFLFMVGSALFFAQQKWSSAPRSQTVIKIIKRSAIIFAIGLLLNAYPFQQPLEQLRVMGVLQRIALCYGIAAIVILYGAQTIRRYVIVFILLSYALLFSFLGGATPYALEQSLTTQFDLAVLGANHLWLGKGQPFDPEGLLSTWPAIASVLIGFEITQQLCCGGEPRQQLRKVMLIGISLLAAGLVSATIIPINKSLWTSSYVLISSAIAILFLAAIIRYEAQSSRPLGHKAWLSFGLNPLFIYIVSWLWVDSYALIHWQDSNGNSTDLAQWLFNRFSHVLSPKNASLLFAILHVLLFNWIAWQLYRRKIVIKI